MNASYAAIKLDALLYSFPCCYAGGFIVIAVGLCFIIGAGTGKAKNKIFQRRLEQVMKALRPYEDKLYCLCDEDGGSRGLHPLSPRLRQWCLSKCSISEFIDIPMEEVTPKKKGKSKPSTKQVAE